MTITDTPEHQGASGLANRLNWLRAGVLGSNDGIVSTAGIVVGVAAATVDRGPIFTAGIAGLAAGAVSMALGEYVSVSTQRDTERTLLAKEQAAIARRPDAEIDDLHAILVGKGLHSDTAREVAEELAELPEKQTFAAHAKLEYGIDPDDLTNPWQAAASSAVSFTLGALLPLIAILLPPASWRVPVCFAVVVIALAITGVVGAKLGGSHPLRPTIRMIVGGAIAMGVTYGIGAALGTAVG